MSEIRFLAVLGAIGLVGFVGIVWVGAHFEARAFERVTGKHVSTWEAVWLELRVEGCP